MKPKKIACECEEENKNRKKHPGQSETNNGIYLKREILVGSVGHVQITQIGNGADKSFALTIFHPAQQSANVLGFLFNFADSAFNPL